MKLSKGTHTRSRGRKSRIKSEIKTVDLIDGTATCSVSIYNTQDGTTQVLTKEYAMTGLADIAPTNESNCAKITVSFDLSSKSYGNGAGIMCSITLNCRQDEESVKLGYDIARAICETEGEEALRMAQGTFNKVVGNEG